MKRGLRALFLFFANFAIYIMEEQLAYSVKAPKLILERADSNSVLFFSFFFADFASSFMEKNQILLRSERRKNHENYTEKTNRGHGRKVQKSG